MFDAVTFLERRICEDEYITIKREDAKRIAKYIVDYIKDRGFSITPGAVREINRNGKTEITMDGATKLSFEFDPNRDN